MASIFRRKKRNGKPADKYSIKYVDFVDGRDKPVVVVGCATKEATKQLANKLETDATLKRQGLKTDTETDSILADCLKDFEAHLKGKRNEPRYITQTISRLELLFDECGFTMLSDLREPRAKTAVDTFRAKFKTQTANHYLTVLKTFCNWANVSSDLLRMKKVRVTDKEQRRVATDIEKAKILKATSDNAEIWGLTGEHRYYLYLVALNTGFRAGELATLYPKAFHLGVKSPYVLLAAKAAKNRQDTKQPIHPSLAKILAKWFKRLSADEPVWPGAWWKKAAKLLRHDLKVAGIEPDTENGTLDFHSLRHTFITNLARAGVHPKTCQILARHSDIKLTMSYYTHLDREEVALALPAV